MLIFNFTTIPECNRKCRKSFREVRHISVTSVLDTHQSPVNRDKLCLALSEHNSSLCYNSPVAKQPDGDMKGAFQHHSLRAAMRPDFPSVRTTQVFLWKHIFSKSCYWTCKATSGWKSALAHRDILAGLQMYKQVSRPAQLFWLLCVLMGQRGMKTSVRAIGVH